MSGGSWNYLYNKEADDLIRHKDDLLAMVNRLKKEGAFEAAKLTYVLYDALCNYEWAYNKFHDKLAPVWKAVEWKDSFDIGQGTLEEAFRDFEESLKNSS